MKDVANFFKSPKPALKGKDLQDEILCFLKKKTSAQQIFKNIKNSPDYYGVSQFLYQSGLFKTLINYCISRLKNKQDIAWPYLLKTFIKHNIRPQEKMEKFIFYYWLKDKKNHSPALFACLEWAEFSLEFKKIRASYLKELERQNLSAEDNLLELLGFVQAQNLIKEEEDIIIQLLAINPLKYQKLAKNLEEKKALITLQEQKKQTEPRDRSKSYPIAFVEKSSLKAEWLKIIEDQAQTHSKRVKPLALFLYFCGQPVKALNLLETHISKISDYWFFLDWSLETRQYTKGLDLLNRLIVESKNESDFLPLLYIKAQMLYALGKKSQAIEHLSAIIQFQPDYKSAQYFLDKWLK